MADPTKRKILFKLKTDVSKLEKGSEENTNKEFVDLFNSVAAETQDYNPPSDSEINIKGKVDNDIMIHYCVNCNLPILKYTRLFPCKHPACLACGEELVIKSHSKCAYCATPISGNEKVPHSQLYCCDVFDEKLQKTCGKSYLSQRDLSAHISHRHGSTTNLL
ncbi:hypothetical protein HZS_750 [Henneguya salminicola]|uniref:E3 ubiquitin-protein ligase Hakai n=1 Tax=Henneguya salminicola TaxID=69463 RepID=A0A6G3MI56_HENSL|nr:hypothetical protein HZS_750 [Henneguya salminicola]